MLCDRCGLRPATVSFTQVVNGVKSESNLCSECAAEVGNFSMGASFELPFQNFLVGLLNQNLWQHDYPAAEQKACSTCGLTYERFKQLGRLGCPDCYEEFEEQLNPLLRRIQGGTEHQGKFPAASGENSRRTQKLQHLRAELNKAIEGERYEKAAELRDTIQALEREEGEH